MSKLKYNYSELERTVIPSLTNTIYQLDLAMKASSNIIIPNRFRYASTIKDLQSFFKTNKNKLAEIKDWLLYSNKLYSSSISEIETNLNGIEHVTIKKRDMIVR